MKEDEHIDLMESYLEGRLSGQEKQDFEQRLATDDSLQSYWKRYQAVQGLLEESASLRLKEKMQALEQKGAAPVKKLRWLPYRNSCNDFVIDLCVFVGFFSRKTE